MPNLSHNLREDSMCLASDGLFWRTVQGTNSTFIATLESKEYFNKFKSAFYSPYKARKFSRTSPGRSHSVSRKRRFNCPVVRISTEVGNSLRQVEDLILL